VKLVTVKGSRKKQVEWLIKWLGFADSENTWEPRSAFDGSPDLREKDILLPCTFQNCCLFFFFLCLSHPACHPPHSPHLSSIRERSQCNVCKVQEAAASRKGQEEVDNNQTKEGRHPNALSVTTVIVLM